MFRDFTKPNNIFLMKTMIKTPVSVSTTVGAGALSK